MQKLMTYLPIIKPEVDVIRNMTDRTKRNKAYINDLTNLRCHGHSLSSCILLKLLLFIHQYSSG